MTTPIKLLIGLSMLMLLVVSGCNSNQYYISKGVVSHSDSLETARNSCVQLCAESGIYRATPKLSECTEKECECLC